MRYTLDGSTIVREDGVRMLVLTRAVYGDDPDVPTHAELREAKEYAGRALAAYSRGHKCATADCTTLTLRTYCDDCNGLTPALED